MTWLPQVPFGHQGLFKIGPLRGLQAQVKVPPRLEDGEIRLRLQHPKQLPIRGRDASRNVQLPEPRRSGAIRYTSRRTNV